MQRCKLADVCQLNRRGQAERHMAAQVHVKAYHAKVLDSMQIQP